MKTKILMASALSIAFLTGCADFGSSADNSSLVPPAAGPQLAPLSVPTYPPVGYNANPSLMASSPIGNSGVATQPTTPPSVAPSMPTSYPMAMQAGPAVPPSQYDYNPTPRYDRGDYSRNTRGGSGGYEQGFERTNTDRFDDMRKGVSASESDVAVGIQNSPILTPNNVIEIQAVGMGVAPESTVSPAQALALAKRAAIVDAYRQIGEKMYGIRINANDTIRDMIAQNSTIKGRVQALIKNAEITETAYKDGLCQVNMEVKLDGRIWHRVLNNG